MDLWFKVIKFLLLIPTHNTLNLASSKKNNPAYSPNKWREITALLNPIYLIANFRLVFSTYSLQR